MKLKSEIDSIKQSYPQIKPVYINIYDPLMDLIQKPQDYGKYSVSEGLKCFELFSSSM